MYGTSLWLPTLSAEPQPSASSGADPPFVFKRWTKVVWVRNLPPVGPCSEPMDCSKRQAIEPVFGQLVSEPAGIEAGEGGVVEFESGTCAHTLLLSNELCQVALPQARA